MSPSRLHVSSRPEPGAFTMVELLVVVAIIGVLAAILVPVSQKALGSGKSAKCASNLRQIGVGMFHYARENDGRLPGAFWDKEIAPYMDIPTISAGQFQKSKIFQCPEDPKSAGVNQRSYTASRLADVDGLDPKGVFAAATGSLSRKLIALEYPSYTILVVENFASNNTQYAGAHTTLSGWTTTTDAGQTHFDGNPSRPYYHGSGANFLLGDGHVEILKHADVVKGQSIPGWRHGRWSVRPY